MSFYKSKLIKFAIKLKVQIKQKVQIAEFMVMIITSSAKKEKKLLNNIHSHEESRPCQYPVSCDFHHQIGLPFYKSNSYTLMSPLYLFVKG